MYGSTYNGHPVALASAYATIKYMIEKRIIQHAAAMESHMQVWPQPGNDRHSDHQYKRECRLVLFDYGGGL